jgi:titin
LELDKFCRRAQGKTELAVNDPIKNESTPSSAATRRIDRPGHGTGTSRGHGRRWAHLVASVVAVLVVAPTALLSSLLVDSTPAWAASPTTVSETFGFNNDAAQSFTVPANVSSVTLTLTGGQGSQGGADSAGRPPAGGYQGVVSGTISVTPGEYLTIAVGAGADEPIDSVCTGGRDVSSPTDVYDAPGGENPIAAYAGGQGGAPGSSGCSGYGGGGGAATVVELGSSSSSPTDIGTIVAGGGGGAGGSGQYVLVKGQIGLASYVAPTTPSPITYNIPAGCVSSCTSTNTIQSPTPLPTPSTVGQAGIAVFTTCGGSTTGSNADQYFNTGAPNSEAGCDGGGGAGGGGGAAGGSAGQVQFGSGTSDEWYGQGGSPGENSTAGIAGLNSLYQYYSDADDGLPSGTDTFVDPGTADDGSVVLSYATGVPAAPTAVSGTAGNGDVALQWVAPSSAGAAPISDYIVEYSSNGGSTWQTYDTGSTATSASVPGLANATGYIFAVEAVNADGDGPFSSNTGTITPSGPPGAPTLTSLTPEDGALQANFTAPASTAPILNYLYQLNGSGPWIATGATTSPLTISGLSDGTTYSIELEAQNSVGTGAASNSLSGTPVALPGAPTITSVQTGAGAATIAYSPGSTGGSTITGYRYSLNGGSTWTTTASTSGSISLTGLGNGDAFSFELEANNASGYGAAASTSFTTPAAPGQISISSITPGNQSLAVSFPAPATGGTPITDYEWSSDGGATWQLESSTGTPCSTVNATVSCSITTLSTNATTPLSNGTSYPIEMRAVNAVGVGSASAPQAATPFTTPSAPTITTGAGGMEAANQSLTVSFTAPSNDGGSAITNYQYSTDAGATWQSRADGVSPTSTTMTISTLSGDGTTSLTNGTTYDIEVRAVNAAGPGGASAVAAGIPVTVPAAPTVDAATPENGALNVTFTPGSNGGAAVNEYDYSLDGGTTWITTGSTATNFTISGLANGTSYPVEVRAVNTQGDSSPSAPVSGTPATMPSQPIITTVSRSNATISVSYSLASMGGSAISSYQYSTDGGSTWQTAGTTTNPLVITSLSTNGTTPIVNGTSYPIEIRAVNAVGESLASTTVNVAPAAVPSAPVVTLTPADGAISVAAAVSNNGGSPITGVDYSLNGGAFVSAGTLGSTFTITGLTNGTQYTVAVRDDNAIGNGTPSAPENATPLTTPGQPTNVVATSDSASTDVTWTAPASTGGAAITSYTATAYTALTGGSVAGTACSTASLACSITGLTNATTYYVSVVATNAAGASLASSPRVAVVPVARPAAPTLTAITPGNSFVSVSFNPGSAGGDPITAYQYSLDGGTTWQNAVATSSPVTISGLTNGVSYTVSLRAVSAAGVGATSTNTETATPFTYPDAVNTATVYANGENQQVAVSWTVPGDEGSTITEAQATAFSNASGGTQEGNTCTTTTNLTVGDTTSCSITGLTNGTTYYISIQSENAAGWSVRSTPRVPATPSTVPGAPTGLTATPGNQTVTLSVIPGSQGSSAITDYLVDESSSATGPWSQVLDPQSSSTSITVPNLTNGETYYFEVYAKNAQGTSLTPSTSAEAVPLAPGVVPTTSTPVATATGFTFTITNYSPSNSYSFSATNGSVTGNGANVTVSGLTTNGTSQVTVGAAAVGYTATQAVVDGSALLSGTAPTFSAPTSTLDGYTFLITNYSPTSTYSFATTNGATATQNAAAVAVIGLAPSESSTVTVTASATGYTDANASVSGAALATVPVPSIVTTTPPAGSSPTLPTTTTVPPPVSTDVLLPPTNVAGVSTSIDADAAPTLSKPRATTGGFTFDVTNYSSGDTYIFLRGTGIGVSDANGAISVNGLSAGQSATITVEAYDDGNLIGKANITGQALGGTTAPSSATSASTETGSTSNAASTGSASSGASGSRSDASASGTNSGSNKAADTSSAKKSTSSLSDLQPGKAAVGISGHQITSQSTVGASGVSIGNHQFGMTVRSSGSTSVSNGGTIELTRGRTFVANGFGLKANSTAVAWLYPGGIRIGTVTVGANGTFTLHGSLPAGISLGHHTLVLRGQSSTGKPIELGLGLQVKAPLAPIASPASDALRPWLAGIAGAIVLGGTWWFLAAWRRRRNEEEEHALLA